MQNGFEFLVFRSLFAVLEMNVTKHKKQKTNNDGYIPMTS